MRISDWSSDVCSSDLIKVPLAAAAEEQDAVAANPPVGGILKQAEERVKARATGNAEDRTLALAQPEIAVRAINLERQLVDRPRKQPVGEQAAGNMPNEKARFADAARRWRGSEAIRPVPRHVAPRDVGILPGTGGICFIKF